MSQLSRLFRCVLLLALAGRAASFAAGPFELISRTDRAPERFGDSRLPSLSADGRYVAFVSDAGNLIPGVSDENSAPDVFFRDRVTGTTTLVTHAAGSPSVAAPSSVNSPYAQASLSADGRYVAFVSSAENMVPGVTDTNGVPDAFLWDRVTGATTLISHASGRPDATPNGGAFDVHISADGQYVTFVDAGSNLVPRQTAPAGLPVLSNLFLWRRSSGALTLVTWRAGSSTVTAHGYASRSWISADGRFVAFDDTADDLVPGQTRSVGDSAFLYDRSSGTVSLVSHAAGDPRSPASNLSEVLGLSADGRWLLFVSYGTNLIAGQAGTVPNVFLYDRTTGTARLIGAGGRGGVMSADGRWVAYLTQSVAEGTIELFLYDRVAGTAAPVAENAAPGQLSADGRFLVYTVLNGDVYLHDRTSGKSALVSHARASATQEANGPSFDPAVSADGGVVVFASRATDLEEPLFDPAGFAGLYDYRRSSGEVSLLTPADPENPALAPDGQSGLGDMSADGRFIIFVSDAFTLVPGQVDGYFVGPEGGFWTKDVFLRDRKTGKTTLLTRAGADPVSRVTAVSGYRPAISADGRVAAFLVAAVKDSPFFRLALYDVAADTETLVDHALGDPGQPDAGYVNETPAISADGRYVAYTCVGCFLVPGQQDGHPGPPPSSDVFLYDRVTDTHVLVSHASGAATTTGNASSTGARISADGRYVTFVSGATDLVPGASAPGFRNVYVFDRDTGAVTLVSHAAGSAAPADGYSQFPGISADGRWIFYLSNSGNLAPGQTAPDPAYNVFLYDRTTGANVLVSHAASSAATPGNRPSGGDDPPTSLSISAGGRWLVYLSTATNLVAGGTDGNNSADVFLYDRITGANRLISSANRSAATAANRGTLRARISADGRRIAFQSSATDLTPGIVKPQVALYLQDRATGSRTRLGLVHTSFRLPILTWGSFDTRLSADGSKVAFTSGLPLAPGDFNRAWDVYLYDAGAKRALVEMQGYTP